MRAMSMGMGMFFAARLRATRAAAAAAAARGVHACAAVRYPRGHGVRAREEGFDIDDIPEFEDDDATSAAHVIVHQQKRILECMRLIERDGPRLRVFRKPFTPPPDALPLVVRTISYAGEDHPATRKQVIVVAVSLLPLRSHEAIHKLKLLAGVRWSPQPPRDAGIAAGERERVGQHGYIKISCEDFPEPAMNLKWGSDVLDNLIKEANDSKDTFADVPQDRRHLDAKTRKHRRGEHVRGRPGHRPTIKDFPQDWLPVQTSVESTRI